MFRIATTNQHNKAIASGALIVVAVLAFLLSLSPLPFVDENTHDYFETAAINTGVSFAAIRGVNAVVSVIQESELEISPAGIGVSAAIGQLLDPLNDMTERLSDILVMALVSLGAQKILLELGELVAFKLIALIALGLIPIIWLLPAKFDAVGQWAMKFVLILLIVRFFLPISAFISYQFETHYMKERIELAKSKLSAVSSHAENLSNMDSSDLDDSGFLGRVRDNLDMISEQKDKLAKAFNHIRKNLPELIAALVELTTLYVVLFLLQVILLPVALFFILRSVFRNLLTDKQHTYIFKE